MHRRQIAQKMFMNEKEIEKIRIIPAYEIKPRHAYQQENTDADKRKQFKQQTKLLRAQSVYGNNTHCQYNGYKPFRQ